jgi:serine/threonine-protein kinase HipA
MNPGELKYCPCTLAEGFNSYSPSALRNMFFGKKVSHILDLDPPDVSEDVAEQFRQNSKTISISGAQFKQSLVLEKNKLRLTQPGESGQYILKPVPIRPPFGKPVELPANEHLTMQIAKQVYGINAAECALIFFRNGEPAYITKRFDFNRNGVKIAQEDFASLSGFVRGRHGEDYKNQGSHEDIARIMKKYVGAYPVEAEKYFELIVFNYLVSNGDAHLKNFSLSQTASGDYVLSPAYDMINTRIHITSDSFFALRDGLFSDGYSTESFKVLGFYAYDDFYEFGRKINIVDSRIVKLLNKYRKENGETRDLINRSFLGAEAKDLFGSHYTERLRMLNNSYTKKI